MAGRNVHTLNAEGALDALEKRIQGKRREQIEQLSERVRLLERRVRHRGENKELMREIAGLKRSIEIIKETGMKALTFKPWEGE